VKLHQPLNHERHHDLLSLRPSIGGHLQINLCIYTTSPTFLPMNKSKVALSLKDQQR
jgi:hypothetical protein